LQFRKAHVEKGIVSVPIGNVVVPSDSWADSIDSHEAVLRKRRPPELQRPAKRVARYSLQLRAIARGQIACPNRKRN
jgi:hypothetical protein